MLVILEVDYQGLGRKGDLKDVKRGYAVNFLIPEGIAVPATKKRIVQLAEQIAAAKDLKLKVAEKAEKLKSVFSGKTVSFALRATPKGKLYGSVTDRDVIAKIKEDMGEELTLENLSMEAVKVVGDYPLTLKLSDTVSVDITLQISAQ